MLIHKKNESFGLFYDGGPHATYEGVAKLPKAAWYCPARPRDRKAAQPTIIHGNSPSTQLQVYPHYIVSVRGDPDSMVTLV